MTSIEQLKICGVRSFDPSAFQTVDFAKPLTVILGKNGAGKTTIIESLLNACTGVMPPGSGAEKSSFVYDPKVIGEGEVKGQLRLKFIGKGAQLIQVTRSFQVIRSGKTVKFSTLDNTIAHIDSSTGKPVSATYRASDVDRVVPEMLCVSPAVLEHVIFCHQEICNWPLGPPKEVKGIFDDIFAATRYVLALERIRENRKLFTAKRKEHEATLIALREHREQAKQLEADIASKEAQVKTIRDRNAGMEPELAELQRVASALDTIEQNIQGLEREASMIEGRMEQKRFALQGAKQLPACKQTLPELRDLKRGLAGRVAAAEEECRQKGEQRLVAERTTRGREEELMQARSQVQILEAEDRQQKQNCVALKEKLSAFPGCGAEHVAIGEAAVDEGALKLVVDSVKAYVQDLEKEAEEKQAARAAAVRAEEERRHAAQRAMDAGNKEAEMLTAQRRGADRKLQEVAAALAALKGEEAEAQLAKVAGEIAVLEERVQALKELRAGGEQSRMRESVIQEIGALNQELNVLREEMANKQLAAGGAMELQTLRTLVADLEADVRASLSGMAAEISASAGVDVGDGAALSAIAGRVLRSRQRRAELLAQTQGEVQGLRGKLDVARQRREQRSEDLTALREELQRSTESCTKVLGAGVSIDTFEAALGAAREAVSALLKKRHSLEAMSACHEDFVRAARDTNACVVCDRPFADGDALERFIQKQEGLVHQSPQEAEVAAQELERAERRLREVSGIEYAVETVRRLTARLAPLEQAVSALEEEAADHAAALRMAEARLRDAEEALAKVDAVAQRIQGLAAKEAEAASQRVRLERRTKEVEAALGPAGAAASGRTFEELSAASEKATARLQRLNVQLSELQRHDDGADHHEAEVELSAKREERYRLQAAVAKAEDLVASRAALEAEVAAAQARLEEVRASEAQQQKAVAAADEAIRAMQEAHRKEERQEKASSADVLAQYHALSGILAQVTEYVKSGKGARLQRMREKVSGLETAVKQGAAEVATLSAELADAQRVIDEQHRRTSELERQIERLELQQSLDEDAERLRSIEAQQRDIKGSKVQNVERLLGDGARSESLMRIRELIRLKISELEKRRASEEGSMKAIVQDVAALQHQLQQDKFQNIENRFRSVFVKMFTTDTAVKDCEKFYSALEKAVQSYHQEKIEQINTIIAELWQSTYRGNDIDTVKICSESEIPSAAYARRSYNYRVVMCRGNTEIDMRGRCSAGQKVLASVVIRLALSQAFCCDCGILALDEPTTNLDEENALALAASLRALIEERGRNVKHFQLIVITHDEQFVRALGGNTLDSYYYVHKDREGAFSVIEKKTFDQLFS